MLTNKQMDKLEKITRYSFKDKALLNQAFCHSSYANENGVKSNERLEFLGDSVLNFVVTKYLFETPSLQKSAEGQLTVKRAEIVSKKPLCELSKELGLFEFLQLGAGAKTEKKISIKFYSNIVEALIGAIFLDSGGNIADAESFILRFLPLAKKSKKKDFKSLLQEKLQENKEKWNYVTEETESGFKTSLSARNETFFGEASTKKEAEQIAAEQAYCKINKK